MAKFEMKRLSRLDWAVIGAAGLSFISLFLPWYGFSSPAFSASVSGWSTSYGWFGGLLIIAAGVYLAMVRSEFNLSSMPVTPAVVVLGASALGTLIVIIRWISLPSGHSGGAWIQLRRPSRHLLDDHCRPRASRRGRCALPGLGREAAVGIGSHDSPEHVPTEHRGFLISSRRGKQPGGA